MNTVHLVYINNAEQDALAILNTTLIAAAEPNEETHTSSPYTLAHNIAKALRVPVNTLDYTVPDEELENWTYEDVIEALLASGAIKAIP